MDIVIKNEVLDDCSPDPLVSIKNEDDKDVKPLIKSSAEILSELFSSFNAQPPELLDNDVPSHRKHNKKSKKKHKKKHKKKRKRNDNSSADSSQEDNVGEKNRKRAKKHKKSKSHSDDLNDSQESEIDEHYSTKRHKKLDSLLKSEESQSVKLSSPSESSGKDTKSSLDPNEKKTSGEKAFSDTYSKKLTQIDTCVKHKNERPTIKIQDLMFSSTIKHNEINSLEKDTDIILSESDDLNLEDLTDEDEQIVRKKVSKKRLSHDERREKHRKRRRSHEKCKRHGDSDNYKNEKESSYRSRSDYREQSHERTYSAREKITSSDSTRTYRSIKDRLGYRDYPRDYYSRKRRSESRERRSRSPSRSRFDKKKLLEIARKNAIIMLKNGSLPAAVNLGPQAQEKVLAAIKAGGKTIDELTDFCKNLSRKEALGELSSVSSGDDLDNSESDTEKPFNHPFQIKERPTSIVMNIPNSTVIPVKTLQEKTMDKSALLMQFPVSSGQQHRKTENEWIPVSPKKVEPVPPVKPKVPKLTHSHAVSAVETHSKSNVPPPTLHHAPQTTSVVPAAVTSAPLPTPAVQIFNSTSAAENLDIGSIVSQRLMAMRKLQENPNDLQAIGEMYRAQQEMQSWATSKQTPGQFTGSTGAQILTAAELASGYQAWARKDQLQTAAPVSGGMGMHLLQKMGWRPGEGLGKEKNGALQPLMLEVKLDKKGLVANEEVKNKRMPQIKKMLPVKTLEGKHPVSLLGEFASKRKMGVPQYELCFECGPSHKKNFLFKVKLNGLEYQPNVASPNKKQAKADAATVCLQQLGVLPS